MRQWLYSIKVRVTSSQWLRNCLTRVTPAVIQSAVREFKRLVSTHYISQSVSLCIVLICIPNVDNGVTVVASIVDICVFCSNDNDFELSTSAFQQFAPLAAGLVPDVTWEII